MRDPGLFFKFVVLFDRGGGWGKMAICVVRETFSYSRLVFSEISKDVLLDPTFENMVVDIPSTIWK